jgi:hypothetical protein
MQNLLYEPQVANKIIFCHVLPNKSYDFGKIRFKRLNKSDKGKGRPITSHEGPDWEQMYSSTLPSTPALDGGGQSHAPAALPPVKDPVPIVQEAGWAPGQVWTGAENLAKYNSPMTRYESRGVTHQIHSVRTGMNSA